MYSIEIWRGGEKLAEARGENEAALLYRGAYEAGDEIRFSSDSQRAVVQVDQQVKPARVYLPSGAFVYRPPMAGDGLARNESGFAARNVIDGEHIACGHGEWPFGSWGIGARTDARLTLDFGREVEINAMTLYLRADFPHDAYWISGTVTLDDGYEKTFPLEGIDGAQRIELGSHRIRTLTLDRLIKCDNPSAFPALRQIEVYGKDTKNDD